MNIHLLDIQSDDIDNTFTITLYGKTETNENIVCHIDDFRPQFFVKIPKTWNKNKFDIRIMNELTYYPFKSKTPRKLLIILIINVMYLFVKSFIMISMFLTQVMNENLSLLN